MGLDCGPKLLPSDMKQLQKLLPPIKDPVGIRAEGNRDVPLNARQKYTVGLRALLEQKHLYATTPPTNWNPNKPLERVDWEESVNAAWAGVVVHPSLIEKRFEINWKEPLGAGGYGIVYEVCIPGFVELTV